MRKNKDTDCNSQVAKTRFVSALLVKIAGFKSLFGTFNPATLFLRQVERFELK